MLNVRVRLFCYYLYQIIQFISRDGPLGQIGSAPKAGVNLFKEVSYIKNFKFLMTDI